MKCTQRTASQSSCRWGNLWFWSWMLLGVSLLFDSRARTIEQPWKYKFQPKPEIASNPSLALKRIADVQVGERVVGENPEYRATSPKDAMPESDSARWHQVNLAMQKSDGSVLRIELLRTAEWFEAHDVKPGNVIDLDLPSMGAVGRAVVISIDHSPSIATGAGHIVTGKYTHSSSNNLVRVYINGLSNPIGCTDNHPFWSEDRQVFVQAGQLYSGERLRSLKAGTCIVSKVLRESSNATVYNLEVNGQHVYNVSSLGILVHNEYVRLYKAPQSGYDAGAITENGYSETNFSGEGAYFTTDPKVAYGYARNYQNGVHEVTVPKGVYDQLVAEGQIVPDPHPGMSHNSVIVRPNALETFNLLSIRQYISQASEQFYELFGPP